MLTGQIFKRSLSLFGYVWIKDVIYGTIAIFFSKINSVTWDIEQYVHTHTYVYVYKFDFKPLHVHYILCYGRVEDSTYVTAASDI